MPSITVLKRRLFQHRNFVRQAITVVFFVAVAAAVVFLISPFLRLGKELLFGPVNIFSVVFPKSSQLKSDNGRVNILLLGIGDPSHDGPNLTDSMMVASFNLPNDDSGRVATVSPVVDLISIPRDIYFDSLGQKINAAYAIGLSKGPDTGLILSKAVVSEVTGLPIHYAVRVDFSVFKDVIDMVGGVDVNVEHVLDDPGYPIDGKETDTCGFSPEEIARRTASIDITPASEIAAFPCRYERLHFNVGATRMDGATALKFVRSRHAQGDEGTDFARAARQQLVIKALRDKVFSTENLLNPTKILALYDQFKDHIDTDFDPRDTSQLLKLALRFRQTRFKNIVLGLSLLENPPVDERGWILVPKSGNWDEVHQYIKNQLE